MALKGHSKPVLVRIGICNAKLGSVEQAAAHFVKNTFISPESRDEYLADAVSSARGNQDWVRLNNAATSLGFDVVLKPSQK